MLRRIHGKTLIKSIGVSMRHQKCCLGGILQLHQRPSINMITTIHRRTTKNQCLLFVKSAYIVSIPSAKQLALFLHSISKQNTSAFFFEDVNPIWYTDPCRSSSYQQTAFAAIPFWHLLTLECPVINITASPSIYVMYI